MVNLDLYVNSMVSEFFTPDGPTVNPEKQNYWPFPSKDNPLKPWTPEEQRKYAEEQLKNLPESPL